MRSVRLYSKSECRPCQEAREVLSGVVSGVGTPVPLDVRVVDVEQDPALLSLYGPHVPVADFGDSVRLYWPFTGDDVRAALERVTGVVTAAEVAASRPVSGRTRAMVLFVDRLVYHFARHWMWFIGLVVALYAGLPLLAPVLMAAGHSAPANLIYSVYRLGCHQLPSRSSFILGYQLAYCQRCMGIYASILVAVVLFAFVRRRLKPLPWQIYLVFIAPMAVDGVTQILGLRFSGWELRILTGALFGIGSAWLALPYLEQGFRDVHKTVKENLRLE